MRFSLRTLLPLLLLALTAPAAAQEGAESLDLFAPGLVAPKEDFGTAPGPDNFAPVPYAPSLQGTPAVPLSGQEHRLILEARLVADGEPLPEGLIWRVFSATPGADGALAIVATAQGGTTTVQLAPGDYLVHAAFGRAGATKKVTIGDDDQMESLVLEAGGLKLDAVVGDNDAIPHEHLDFEILQENDGGELITIIPHAKPAYVLRLKAGTYHVISRYGGVNAIVRADFQVEPGKLTEATMRHTGAEVTLKLVSEAGGEAIANTSWTVLTADGLTVHESIGAFPSLVLAEGDYSAVASHQDDIYSRDFKVEAGINRDVEVQLADLVEPEPLQQPNAGAPRGGP